MEKQYAGIISQNNGAANFLMSQTTSPLLMNNRKVVPGTNKPFMNSLP